MAGLIACLAAGTLPAHAQMPDGIVDQEVALRFQAEMQRLRALGPQATEYVRELQKQYDAYTHNAKARQTVIRETMERMARAREAFNRYYQGLVAEGNAEDAERMKKLFEISLQGVPLTTASTAAAPPAAPQAAPVTTGGRQRP